MKDPREIDAMLERAPGDSGSSSVCNCWISSFVHLAGVVVMALNIPCIQGKMCSTTCETVERAR